MRTEDAIAVLYGMVYKPGWTFFCTPSGEYDGMIHIVISVDTVNSNDTPNYKKPTRNTTNYIIDVSNCLWPSEVHVLMLHLISLVEQHEMREFLGFKAEDDTEWLKPYHPHTVEGRRTFRRLPSVSYNEDAQAYHL